MRGSTTVCASKLHTTQVSHVWRNVQQLVQHNTGKFYHTVYWIQFLHIVGINLTLPPRRRLQIFYVGFIVPLLIIRFRFFEITDNSNQFAFPKAVRQKSGFHVQGIQLKRWPCWQMINGIIRKCLSLSSRSLPFASAWAELKFFSSYYIRHKRVLSKATNPLVRCNQISALKFHRENIC